MADTKISDLTGATTLAGTEVVPVVQSATTKKATITQVLALAQPLDATLTALAGLGATAGLVEQTGADTFTQRLLGVGATTSIPTRADADARFAPITAIPLASLAALTASRAVYSDASGVIVAHGTLTDTELGYVDGVTSAIQTQLNAKAPSTGIALAALATLTASRAVYSDASGVIVAHGTLTDTELGYVDGVTSAIQTQLDGKQASLGFTAENVANKNAVSGYAGLDAGSKLTASQMTELLAVTDLTTYASASGTGTAAILATFTSLQTNDVATWNGSNWINQAPGGGLSGLTTGVVPYATSATTIADGPITRIDAATVGVGALGIADAATVTTTDVVALRHRTSGTPLPSYGTGLVFVGDSATVDDRAMARIAAIWSTATDASRAAYLSFQTVTAAGAPTERWQMTAAGHFVPGTTNTYDIGTAALSVRGGYYVASHVATANGALGSIRTISELITLNLAGVNSDSVADLLPANAFILSVTARVTTTITGATDWNLTDTASVNRFAVANATLTAGTTMTGLRHLQGAVATDALGPVQITAAKFRITTTGTATAGIVRVTVVYFDTTPPTS